MPGGGGGHGIVGMRERAICSAARLGNQLTGVAESGPGGERLDSFGYDPAGNVTSRTTAAGAQALGWDAEGRLARVSAAGKVTSFVYDADGGRLLRRDPGGTTLYLRGMELRLDKGSGTVSATRYYMHNGAVVAVRTAAGVSFLVPDRHGTAQEAIDAAGLRATFRRSTPFGEVRGERPAAWPGERGFVGGRWMPRPG